MKKNIVLLLAAMLCMAAGIRAQQLPAVKLKDLQGREVTAADFTDSSRFTIVSFWATWCKPCMQELDAIAEMYDDWQKDTRSRVVAVAVDDSRTMPGVKALVKGRGWPFEVFADVNQDLKRALNIGPIPYTIIINNRGQIIRRHSGYTPGSEQQTADFLKKQQLVQQ